VFFYNLGRQPEVDRQNRKLVEDMAKMRVAGVPVNKQGTGQSRSEPRTEAVLPTSPPPPVSATQTSNAPENPVLNERRAVGTVRVIGTAVTTYCSTYKHPPGSLADLASARLINSALASGQASGYSFSVQAIDCGLYGVVARPLIWNSTGSVSVYLDETGDLHTTRENRPAMRADPALPGNRPSATAGQGPPESTTASTPVTQVLARGNFVVPPTSYRMVTFTVPQGATEVRVRGTFAAFGGSGNDVQVLVASPLEFQNWINGHQAQAFYSTGKVTNGTINIDDLPPGDYVLAFSNKFSAFTRKQVTAQVTLSYIP
jgi:hypothetical protein